MDKDKSVDDLMEEYRSLERRTAEMYGLLIEMREHISVTHAIIWALAGANAGVLLVISVLLFK